MKILLAVDDSRFSKAAAKALLQFSPPAGSVVRVLHVLEPPSALVARSMSGYRSELRMTAELQRRNAARLVARIGKELRGRGLKIATSVVLGDPRSKILDIASSWKADLIVIGSHGRRGLERFLLGSVSETVVRHANCSVQVVRLGPAH
jgi:nucleotide-binding universal stress UspA family protein